MKDFSLLSANPFSNARGPMYNPRGRVTAGGGGGGLSLTASGQVFRYTSAGGFEGASLDSKLFSISSTTTPTGVTAESKPYSTIPALTATLDAATGTDRPLYLCCMAKIGDVPGGAGGDLIRANGGWQEVSFPGPGVDSLVFNDGVGRNQPIHGPNSGGPGPGSLLNRWVPVIYVFNGAAGQKNSVRIYDPSGTLEFFNLLTNNGANLNASGSFTLFDDMSADFVDIGWFRDPGNFLEWAAETYGFEANPTVDGLAVSRFFDFTTLNVSAGTYGYRVRPTSNVSITHIGGYAPSSGGAVTKLAIWRQTDGVELASANVDFTGVAEGEYVETAISPVSVAASQEIVLSAYRSSSWFFTFNPRYRQLGDDFELAFERLTSSGADAMPTGVTSIKTPGVNVRYEVL